MRKKAIILLALVLAFSTMTACVRNEGSKAATANQSNLQEEEKKPTEFEKKLDNFFQEVEAEERFSGYVLIAQGEEILFSKGYGYADFANLVKNTADTQFGIASLSKQLITTAVMTLYDKGLLDVQDKLEKYLPDFPYSDKITIHQLMTHSSGLPEAANGYDLAKHCPVNPNRVLGSREENEKELSLIGKPGEGFRYGNVAYSLLTCVVEAITNKPFEQYLYEEVCLPLGMEHTGFRQSSFGKKENLAQGYQFGPESLVDNANRGGVVSTPNDMYKWCKSLYSGKLIKPETQEMMHTAHMGTYGYGWYVVENGNGDKTFSHQGKTSGFTGYLFQTKSGLYMILLSNIENIDFQNILGNVNAAYESEILNK